MTPIEIIAAAREIVNASMPCATHSYSHQHAVAKRHALTVARELLRLHDGAEWTATPPTKPGHYWHKDVMEQKTCSVYGLFSCKGRIVEAYTLNLASDFGGFWLGPITPATASAMAVLRAENERLVQRLHEACGQSETILKSSNTEISHLQVERDRLAAELAEAKAALAKKHQRIEELGAKVCQMRSFMRNIIEGKYTSSQLIELAKIALGGVQVEAKHADVSIYTVEKLP